VCRSRRRYPIKTGEIEWSSPRVSCAGALRRRFSEIIRILAKAIVDSALLWIGKDIERFSYLLEALFGGFVARIYVRVILACEPPVSFLDLFRLGIALHAENLVEVFLGHYFIVDCQTPIDRWL